MKKLMALLLTCFSLAQSQILTHPNQRTVPGVSDNSGLIMDIYKQTNAQNAQLSAMATQVADIKDSVTRIETAQEQAEKNMDAMRHDVDKQGVVANLFVYSAQTVMTIIIAVCVTVPGTFFVQKFLNDRFTRSTNGHSPTQTPSSPAAAG